MDDGSMDYVYLCLGVAAVVLCCLCCCVGNCCSTDYNDASATGPVIYGQGPDRVASDLAPPPPPTQGLPMTQGYVILTDPATGQQQVYAPVTVVSVVPMAAPEPSAHLAANEHVV